jgi:hypothetical protein
MADRGDLKPRTLESYREIAAHHLAPAIGATRAGAHPDPAQVPPRAANCPCKPLIS